MASFVENVNKVAALIPAESVDLGVVADNIDNINLLKPAITDLQSIVNNVVPNIAEILLADDNAATATTKAGEASTSASEALGYRNEALGFRDEAEAFSESKAFVVETVEDLLTIPSSYVTAIVRDLDRGGTFIYDATKVGESNDGTNFSGWVRHYSGLVNVKWFGAVGDGVTDDTIAIQSASSIGGNVIAEGNFAVTKLTLNNSVNFKGTMKLIPLTSNDWVIEVNSQYVSFDKLDINFPTLNKSTHKGMLITKSFFSADRIRITCNDKLAGVGGLYSAVRIGDGLSTVIQCNINYIGTYGFDYPVYIDTTSNINIGEINCQFYRRGVYVKDCKYLEITSINCAYISSNCVGSPGENALLVESVTGHETTSNITIGSIDVNQSGEHGVRLGGGNVISNFFVDSIYTKRTGSGAGTGIEPDNHGGCGFKVLGPTVLGVDIKHKNINVGKITVEGIVNSTRFDGTNFAGIQLGKCENVVIGDCQVVPECDATGRPIGYSASNGIEIIGCTNITVDNLQVVYPKFTGAYIYSGPAYNVVTNPYYYGINKNININNLIVKDTVKGIELSNTLDYTATQYNINVSNAKFYNVTNAVYVFEVSGGYKGAYENCYIQFDADTVSSDLVMAPLTGVYIDGKFSNASVLPVNRRGSAGSTLVNKDTAHEYKVSSSALIYAIQSKTHALYIATDSFVTVSTLAFPHFVSLCGGGITQYGQFWVRPTSSPASIVLHAGADVAIVNTALTGTTGTVGKITIGIQNGLLYIENRAASAQTIYLTDIC